CTGRPCAQPGRRPEAGPATCGAERRRGRGRSGVRLFTGAAGGARQGRGLEQGEARPLPQRSRSALRRHLDGQPADPRRQAASRPAVRSRALNRASIGEKIVPMRTTLALDDELIAKAQAFTGVKEKSALVREALKALIERESARRLARLGGTQSKLKAPRRRRATRPGFWSIRRSGSTICVRAIAGFRRCLSPAWSSRIPSSSGNWPWPV